MIGNKITELIRVDSTNEQAGRLFLLGHAEDGDVIWAHEQYAGRGQHYHTWESEAGKNLTFTVIFRPAFLAPDRQFELNKVVSLAVVDFINQQLHPASGIPFPTSRIPYPVVSIKWPNDIYIGDRKVGGILIENKIMGATLETSFAGIGVNINQEVFPAYLPNPVSLVRVLGREIPLKDSLLQICSFLDRRYQMLKERHPGMTDREFDQHLLGFGEWRTYLFNDNQIEGKIMGVNSLGQLQIETRTGETLLFNHGEIGFAYLLYLFPNMKLK